MIIQQISAARYSGNGYSTLFSELTGLNNTEYGKDVSHQIWDGHKPIIRAVGALSDQIYDVLLYFETGVRQTRLGYFALFIRFKDRDGMGSGRRSENTERFGLLFKQHVA